MPYSFVDMVLYFFIYSFCGWLMETVLCSVHERRFVNRGFLFGPLCPIYGCGILLILTLLLPVRNDIPRLTVAIPVIFLAGAALASAVEYVTSWAMETLFHARWWDYTDHHFHVNGRICLSISLAWGALATGFVYLIQPLFERFVLRLGEISSPLPPLLAAGLSALFLADTVLSVRAALLLSHRLEQLDRLSGLIREHIALLNHLGGRDSLSAEDICLRLENAYDRYEAHRRSRREKRAEPLPVPSEEPRAWLASRIELLKVRRDELQTPGLFHRRLLKAFPSLRSHSSTEGMHSAAEPLESLRRKKK
ncbi:MAG: putative ABC transporter permease [Clostridiales bacterium]|nr:putative ABC transporter permease [Clostridiales bacterium]